MKITLEQVERLRKRIDCDYQTAEKILRKTHGNEDQAVLYILKKRDHRGRKLLQLMREMILKIFGFQLVLLKEKRSLMKAPILILVFVVLFFDVPMFFLLILAIVAIAMGYEFEVYYKNFGMEETQSEDWQDLSPVRREEKDEKQHPVVESDDQQDYEEIIIE